MVKALVLYFVFLTSLSLLSDTKVIVLGSGTPNPNPERYGSSYAVVVDDKAYIVDFGPGSVRRMAEMSPTWGGAFKQLELQNISIAFLTHIHSDHSVGLSLSLIHI